MKNYKTIYKKYGIYTGFVFFLAVLSFLIYLAQVKLFHDIRNTEFYLLQDIAFLPLQILLGVLVFDRIISRREKNRLMSKLNMVIGAFFGECGNGLLSLFSSMTRNEIPFCGKLGFSVWTKKEYSAAALAVTEFPFSVEIDSASLSVLRDFLKTRREPVLRLLENPNLLEHERFTDLLWAVTHCAEELEHRGSFDDLPPADMEHLRVDILRAYRLLLLEWLSYMMHLQGHYPYLFSLAVRKNPFVK